MDTDRPPLPHETDRLFLTDGGTETWLIHKRGLDLPNFSSFHLLNDDAATEVIRSYYRAFANIAVEHDTAFIFDSLTYRASRDWGELLGYSASALAEMNLKALALYREVAAETDLAHQDAVISGCIGPKGDAYERNDDLTAGGAEEYHQPQIDTFKSGDAHMVTALSLSSSQEAIGIARAARSAGLPSAISFMVEKDHCLGSGESLQAAIETVDEATGSAAAYFMINCAHPVDFGPALTDQEWVTRVHGFRANASKQEHSFLNTLGHLDEGDPDELASEYASLQSRFPHMNVGRVRHASRSGDARRPDRVDARRDATAPGRRAQSCRRRHRHQARLSRHVASFASGCDLAVGELPQECSSAVP